MGFKNPPIPWNELERTLSGRRPDPRPVNADGGVSNGFGKFTHWLSLPS